MVAHWQYVLAFLRAQSVMAGVQAGERVQAAVHQCQRGAGQHIGVGKQLDTGILAQVFLHQVKARALATGGISERRTQRQGVCHMAKKVRLQAPHVDDAEKPAGRQRFHGQFDEQAARQGRLASLLDGQHQVVAIAADGGHALALHGADHHGLTIRLQCSGIDKTGQCVWCGNLLRLERDTRARLIAQGIGGQPCCLAGRNPGHPCCLHFPDLEFLCTG